MTTRRSIEVEGFGHGQQPIPAASRVGPLVMTGGVYGLDPQTGDLPDDPVEQVRLMFINLERIMHAAGGSMASIARVTIYMKVPDIRSAVNEEWLRRFPDPSNRPARHSVTNGVLPANMVVQCDATAWIA